MDFFNKPNYTLSYYRKAFGEAAEQSMEFLNPLPEDIVNQRPESDSWSITECYDHLIHTGYSYLNLALPAIDHCEENGIRGRGPFKHRLLVEWFISTMRPPYKVKFSAPQPFLPKSDLNKEEVIHGFITLQYKLLHQLDRISELNMNKIKVPYPIFPLMKLNISEMFAIIDAHQQRHFWQARQILKRVSPESSQKPL